MANDWPACQDAKFQPILIQRQTQCNMQYSPLLRLSTNVTPTTKHSFTKLKSFLIGFFGPAFLGLPGALRMATGQNTEGQSYSASLNPPIRTILFSSAVVLQGL